MKPWMKILIWLGLGGGIGFFAGYQVGTRSREPEMAQEPVDGPVVERVRDEAEEALKAYRGADEDSDRWVDDCLEIDDLGTAPVVETVTANGGVKVVPVDIPQLHPQDMVPVPITEEEFNLNEKELDILCLDYYERDEVLYDPEHEEVITVPEQLLGYGWNYRFGGDPNNPVDVIYIQNETMGAIYRVELVDAAFYQEDPEVAADMAPDDDEEDDEED